MGVSEWFWLNDCLCQIWLIKSMHTGNNPIIGGRSVKITSTAWKNKIINFLHNMHVHKSRGFLRSWWRNVLIVECLPQFSKNSLTSCQWQIWNDFSSNIIFSILVWHKPFLNSDLLQFSHKTEMGVPFWRNNSDIYRRCHKTHLSLSTKQIFQVWNKYWKERENMSRIFPFFLSDASKKFSVLTAQKSAQLDLLPNCKHKRGLKYH